MVGIAERTGLIGSLTFWVLNAALRQLAEWKAAGRKLRIAINLSNSTLTDRELPAVVDQSLKTWGIAPADLTLEIAESAMISDAERSLAILTRLKAVGVRLAIDDFGSGFSSLAHMRRFPLDELKIDRPFVAGMLSDPGDRALVHSVIDLGHHFGLRVAAEGVERPELRSALAALGCDLAQGDAVSVPLPPAAFREWWTVHASGA
jgi:EAL domain-containing protein (putative c-di-GMP-specific phosphodiesterase class I)